MYIPLKRSLTVLLTAVVILGASALPAAAETTAQSAMPAISVATQAQPSVVGILNTMKATSSTQKGHAAGTGFIYKPGIIITNAHVVDKAQELKILYADKSTEVVNPTNVFSDVVSDIAVIKVTNTKVAPLNFGDSDKVTVGEAVFAVGNPLGFRLGNSISGGILSGVGRAIGSAYPFLQTDAPINPGNSGGPLLNSKGEVIGVNSNKMADIGVEGLGFAIPINTAKQIAETLLKDGKVERATLGLELGEDWQAYFGVPSQDGVPISSIISDGPVGMTGLRTGDKLVKLDNTPIYSSDDLYAFMANKKPGDKVTISVKRSGQLLSVTVTLASQDEMKKIAEEGRGTELGGILMGLTAGQIQEAADFGKKMSSGYANINDNYFAISGSNYAVLYTEYLYVARRVSSAYEFGFTPGAGFQSNVAKEIANKIEVQMEIHGDSANFLNSATYTVQQGNTKVDGFVHGPVTYTTSPDGKVVIANVSVRFATTTLNPTDTLTIIAQPSSGKTTTFEFEIKDLR